MLDRSFYMTKENADRVRSMSGAEFQKHAAQELDRLKLTLRVAKKACQAKRKAMRKGEPFTLESVRGGLGTAEKCRTVLAELQQKMDPMENYEKGDVMKTYTTEELRERKELTDAIVANLKIINEDRNDLEDTEKKVRNITAGLNQINEDETDLDELEKQVRNTVAGLKEIDEHEAA
jgi:hypothetical protein